MHKETDHKRRYSRHFILPEFGEEAQNALSKAKILVIGAGGLGCASLPYLSASGVGTIGIIDPDSVEISNLQRQILFEEGDIGRAKVAAATDALQERNNALKIITHETALDAHNAANIIADYDIVLDGCDRFETRFIVNSTCQKLGMPLVSAAVIGWHGHISSFTYAKDTPCYQCFVPEMPEDADTCSETGVISPLCGVIGAVQALEAIKLLTHVGTNLVGRVARYDALSHRWSQSKLEQDPACPCCASSKSL